MAGSTDLFYNHYISMKLRRRLPNTYWKSKYWKLMFPEMSALWAVLGRGHSQQINVKFIGG